MPDIAARRWLFLILVLTSTTIGVHRLWSVLRIDGLTDPEILFLALFAILFGWVAISFWIGMFGAWARLSGVKLLPLSEAAKPSGARTAILMPVYNEDVARVFAGVQAMRTSVGSDKGFDFYILSDSTDPAHWIAEEVEWQRLRDAAPDLPPLFYRHRHRNVGRKSGNIQDFCENWGTLYDYMVVLDADSLMSGETLRRLVRLMDANPRTALIQAPPQLVGRRALFGRIQQFASSVYGPIYSAGIAWLQGPQGNYWGHNAIIRVRAFMAHGGLPKLPGRPPFGGEIMSHDFVEAALLVRAGWQVWMAPELGGSFEEPPPTATDFLKRDRRWCQGNLQHLRIVFAQGLKMPSRLHLAMGIMAYVSSPLWLMLLIVSAVNMAVARPDAPFGYFGRNPQLGLAVSHASELLQLAAATVLLLYGPKLAALLVTMRDRTCPRGAWRRRRPAAVGHLRKHFLHPVRAGGDADPQLVRFHHRAGNRHRLGGATSGGTGACPFWQLRGAEYWPHTLAGLAGLALLYHFIPGQSGLVHAAAGGIAARHSAGRPHQQRETGPTRRRRKPPVPDTQRNRNIARAGGNTAPDDGGALPEGEPKFSPAGAERPRRACLASAIAAGGSPPVQ